MGKRRKKSRKRGQQSIELGDKTVIALTRLGILRKSPLIDDRRRFRPTISTGYLLIDGRPVNYGLSQSNKRNIKDRTQDRLAFTNPAKVIECRKRKTRRETLFRKRKIGKGKSVSKRRIMKESSKIKC